MRFVPRGEPLPGDGERISSDCSCPDWANPCKHVAAPLAAVACACGRDAADLLGLTDEAYEPGGLEAAKVCGAPPLRTDADSNALWDAMRSGDIQTIGSDNTSWTVKQKEEGAADFRKVPYGVPVSRRDECHLLRRRRQGHISLQTFVAAFSTTPARLFGLYPRKRHYRGGQRRRLLILDPDHRPLTRAFCTHVPDTIPSTVRSARRAAAHLVEGGDHRRDGKILSRPGRGQLVLRERRPRSHELAGTGSTPKPATTSSGPSLRSTLERVPRRPRRSRRAGADGPPKSYIRRRAAAASSLIGELTVGLLRNRLHVSVYRLDRVGVFEAWSTERARRG